MKNIFKSFLIFFLIFILFLFYNLFLIFAQVETKNISVGGKIINYYKINLNEDLNEEIVIIYKNLFKKKIYFSIYSYENDNLIKLFDQQVEDFYYSFSFAKIESQKYFNIVFLGSKSLFYLILGENKILKLFDLDHIYKYNFEDQFPLINLSNDFDNDGEDEFFIFDDDFLNIYRKKEIVQKIKINLKSLYDYSLNFGGFNVVHSIFILLPDIIFVNLNNDKYTDFVLIYQKKIVSYYYDEKEKKFLILQDLNLSNYITIRAGYSPINKYIFLDDFNGDKLVDLIVLNFSFASIFNTDKLGTEINLFYGSSKGQWKEQPDKKIYLNEISGIESYFIFSDINSDGLKDFINIGTKIFSSNFIVGLTVKRSFLVSINAYLGKKDGNFDMNPVYNLNKNLSLDSETTQDSTQIDFSSYGSINLADFFNSIFGYFEKDLNKDNILDLIVYNFDGTYSIYYSDKKNPNIYNKKENQTVYLQGELKKIFYLAGPYILILDINNDYLLLVINKSAGKIYFKKLKV